MAEYPINPKQNVFKKYRTVNYINSYVFAPPVDLTTNTEIGGVASTISTPALLASKLAIDVSRITNFSIVGSYIKCKIASSYEIPNFCFDNNTNISYYIDSDSLVTNIGNYAFSSTVKIKFLEFKGIVNSTSGAYCVANSNITRVYLQNVISIFSNQFIDAKKLNRLLIPKCTVLGSSVASNGVFSNVPNTCVIYTNTFLSTNNSGTPDGDLIGRNVSYVNNFTPPDDINNLSYGTIYNTAVQLNFTPPSSLNSISYYEVFESGVFASEITIGGYVGNLTASTSYNFAIVAIDIFGNRSLFSNSVTVSTNTIETPKTIIFKNRVYEDVGVIINESYLDSEYLKITNNSLENYLLFWHNYKTGIKKNNSNLVEKLYSFVGENTDVIQLTTSNKPAYTVNGITFDSDDKLEKTLSPVITNRSFTIMYKLKATPVNYLPIIDLGGWDKFTFHSANGGLIYSGITVANRFNLSSGSFLTNTDATYSFTYNAITKTAKIYRDSTLLSTKTMIDPTDFTLISIGANNGTFYDSKLFSKDLTLTEITSIL